MDNMTHRHSIVESPNDPNFKPATQISNARERA